jgi:hypothetical protein
MNGKMYNPPLCCSAAVGTLNRHRRRYFPSDFSPFTNAQIPPAPHIHTLNARLSQRKFYRNQFFNFTKNETTKKTAHTKNEGGYRVKL